MFAADFYTTLCFADGSFDGPPATALIKAIPADFQVIENMPFDCSGEGEHIWLNITKTEQHTTQVANNLAKLAGIAAKHVGFSGMKDHRAVTSQWFSAWLPGVRDEDLPDWSQLTQPNTQPSEDQAGLVINSVQRHSKKLQRGAHRDNEFTIRLRDFTGDLTAFSARIAQIEQQGVPSYFGEQRFGYAASNLNKASEWFEQGYKIKQPNKRSLLLSSARAWLFNTVLSKRLAQQNWLQVLAQEPLNLAGSKAYFISEDIVADQLRLEQLDINTTGPLWGRGVDKVLSENSSIYALEQQTLQAFPLFLAGLEKAGLSYERRALRMMPIDLQWQQEGQDIVLQFSLLRGQFATSLLRELVTAR